MELVHRHCRFPRPKGGDRFCLRWLFGALTLLASSCAPVPGPVPVTPPIEETSPPEPPVETDSQDTGEAVDLGDEVIVHALAPDEVIITADDPWALVESAKRLPPQEAASLLISAISGFIEFEQPSDAQTLVHQLDNLDLSAEQVSALQLQRAKLAQLAEQHELALQLLDQMDDERLTLSDKTQKLLLTATSKQFLNQSSEAMHALLERERLLSSGSPEQIENQRLIVDTLRLTDPLRLALLKEEVTDPTISGWIALADILQIPEIAQRYLEFNTWKTIFPTHPIRPSLLEEYLNVRQEQPYRHIALLIPLTSQYGLAARAFYDGFVAAHSEDTDAPSPLISLHDIGADAELSSFYYQSAVAEGADFVVGPLGREAADALFDRQSIEVPTLVISDIPEAQSQATLYGISLSPESEARQVAQKAYTDGHRQVLVFRTDSALGLRIATAFEKKWQELGGHVVQNSSFPPAIPDYSRIIKKLLEIDQSVARKQRLRTQLGIDLKFTPRRRDDIDFLFLAANAKQARQVVPQLRFFQAHDLPLYATSVVYSGEPNPGEDSDLDGLVFGEIRWLWESVQRYKAEVKAKADAERQAALAQAEPPEPVESQAEEINAQPADAQETTEAPEHDPVTVEPPIADEPPVDSPSTPPASPASPYENSPLDRLYALGYESYQLIPQLETLRKNNWVSHFGKTMTTSIDKHGNVERHLKWVRFRDGLIEGVAPLTLPAASSPLHIVTTGDIPSD